MQGICDLRQRKRQKVVKRLKSSGIGGQAVIEGVMMKNKDCYAVAVRTPDDKIEVDKQRYESFSKKHAWARLPLVRGVVTFAESLSIGMKTLTYSASFYEEEEEQEEGKFEKAMSTVFKEKAEAVVTGFTIVLALILAIGIFMVLPWFLGEQLGRVIENTYVQAAAEGVLRLVIFILYVFAISLMEDIRRVYMYHGAEHKTINCVENGLELTVENVRKQSREHKRCGTSFMLYVMVISIVFFMLIRVDNAALRIVFRVLLIPVVAGVSYEFIRFAGNTDNPLVNLLSRPGMWMQGLTTREPDDSMIEVAIKSVEAVFDWRGYLAGESDGTLPEDREGATPMVAMEHPDAEEDEEEDLTASGKTKEQEAPIRVAVAKRADHSVRRGAYAVTGKTESRKKEKTAIEMEEVLPEEKKEQTNTDVAQETAKTDVTKSETTVHHVAALKKAAGVRRPMQPVEELRRDSILVDAEQDDDDDEILSALDKFFE